jgi:hypothetical protein
MHFFTFLGWLSPWVQVIGGLIQQQNVAISHHGLQFRCPGLRQKNISGSMIFWLGLLQLCTEITKFMDQS